jgi:hypothetical protein
VPSAIDPVYNFNSMRLALLSAVALLAGPPLARSQASPPAAPPATPAQEAPAASPVAPVLENTGQPMLLPFSCTVEDIQSAGLACTEAQPCPVYLELTSVGSVGNRIFVAGNLHSSAVTMFSAMLGSEDGGRSWREVHDRIRSASLDRIQFLDAETGWAAGEILSPLPQDPFLLLTTDGGKTWRQRSIFSEDAEDRLGIILQFVFTARDSGSLIIDRGQGSDSDRYELYESPDGGESWSFKQSSTKPIQLRVAPPGPGAWRLHVDRTTRSFQIQNRQAEKWNAVASFLAKAGACKP